MINKIMPVCNTLVNKTANKVSFGMANLNEIGRQSEDSFGYQANSFLDTNMYLKKAPHCRPVSRESAHAPHFRQGR